eukprot:jgi/Psemu1/15967/gm1.15967_g
MTRNNNTHGKRPPASNSNNKGNMAKRVRVEDPPPNTPAKHDDDQRKHRMSEENNFKAALSNESYATDEFLRNLSLEVTTCFTALTTKVYLVSSIIESEPRADLSKTTSTTSRSEKKGRRKKKKSDTTLMVNLFLSKVENGVTGVLELLTRKQISERFKDYDLNNKWLNFESLLGNVEDKISGASLYGRNVINYGKLKKYMLFYREILVWYMKNVQYPPGPDNASDGLFFHTKCKNGSPHYSKQYVNSMKNFLDCLMANSSLRVSLSHRYNQALRKLWVDFQQKSKRIFTTLSLCHLDMKLLTHKDLYQYFFPELFQNSFVLGTTVLLGEKWVPLGFHWQGDMNVPKTGQVILPLHSSLVFHYVIHYKDTVSNYYNVHFEFNDGRLAPFTDTKGIIYLVNQWLIRKVVDPGKILGANVVLSLETACIQFISQVSCASMVQVDVDDSSFDCWIENVCKVILPKVLKATDNGCFGYDHVMETIEDLVLTKRRFLAGTMLPELNDKKVSYFERMDRLYIHPTARVLSKTQFAHVKFEDTPEQLVTGILELSGLDDKYNNQTCVTRFLQYDVNSQQEVHQQIFMEHIPYVFREIFVIDPEVVKHYTWVEELILYSYLPEMGIIFTPLTEKLAGYLLEKSDDLSLANLLVKFLDGNVVKNYGKGTGELNPAFNSLQGCDFVFHKVTDFETWNCFKTSKDDRKNGTNRKTAIRTKGDSKDAGTCDGGQVTQRPTTTKGRTNNECGSTDEGNTIENKKEVPVSARPLIRGLVKVPKYPLRSRNAPYSYGFLRMPVNVVFKEQDPEILYTIYKIKEQVLYAARGQFPARIGEVSRYIFQKFMNYNECPGYDILFRTHKGDQCGEVLGSNYESRTSSSDNSSSDDYKSSDSESTKNVSEDYNTPTSSSLEESKDKDSTSSFNPTSSEEDDEDEALV